jgi:hypothetical protein
LSDNCFEAKYVPPRPNPTEGMIVVTPPKDSKGYTICPVLHLTPELAEQLMETLKHAIDDYESYPS